MKHCLCLPFPCKVNNLEEKGLLCVQRMVVGGHKNFNVRQRPCVVRTTRVFSGFFFVPQNCLNLFIHTISCFLKTFLFDNSFHSPIMAEILARCPHNAVNCQIFKLSLSRSFPPPPLHLNTANNIKIDRRLEKVTLSLESKILFDDVVRTTRVVSNVNLANFTQVMYNIIKKTY